MRRNVSKYGRSEKNKIQFLKSKSSLDPVVTGRDIHGDIVPPISRHRKHHDLFVYRARRIVGGPYIQRFISPEGELEVLHPLQTERDLGSLISLLSYTGASPRARCSYFPILLMSSSPAMIPPKQLITRCIDVVRVNASLVDLLPTVLAERVYDKQDTGGYDVLPSFSVLDS